MHTNGTNPETALQMLMAGNQRFVQGAVEHPHQDHARRAEVAGGQKPFAIILSCSDSRVAPEVVFDQGLGDLFIVRDAGNVADDVMLGSIEYAAEHLGANLVMVLGHQKCGAVTAAVAGGEVPGHIGSIVKHIAPAVEAVKSYDGDKVWNATVANVKRQVLRLESCEPMLSEMVRAGRLKIVGGIYSLDNGSVNLV